MVFGKKYANTICNVYINESKIERVYIAKFLGVTIDSELTWREQKINVKNKIFSRDGSVSKMCTSGGRQCKTVPIPGLRVLVHPNQTWTFPLNDIAIKVPKWPKYERNLYNFAIFLVCS